MVIVKASGYKRSAYISGTNNLAFADPQKVGERKNLRADVEDCVRRLALPSRICNGDCGIMAGKGEGVAGGTKGDTLDPPSRLIEKFARHGVERQALSPNAGLRTFVDTLDESTQDSGVAISASQGEQDVVWVPCDAGDCAAERLLQVLRDPPVVLFLEIADGGDTGTASDGKLGLARAPANTGGSPVDAEQDEGGTPCVAGSLPDVGVSVLTAGHNPSGVWSNVDASD